MKLIMENWKKFVNEDLAAASGETPEQISARGARAKEKGEATYQARLQAMIPKAAAFVQTQNLSPEDQESLVASLGGQQGALTPGARAFLKTWNNATAEYREQFDENPDRIGAAPEVTYGGQHGPGATHRTGQDPSFTYPEKMAMLQVLQGD